MPNIYIKLDLIKSWNRVHREAIRWNEQRWCSCFMIRFLSVKLMNCLKWWLLPWILEWKGARSPDPRPRSIGMYPLQGIRSMATDFDTVSWVVRNRLHEPFVLRSTTPLLVIFHFYFGSVQLTWIRTWVSVVSIRSSRYSVLVYCSYCHYWDLLMFNH